VEVIRESHKSANLRTADVVGALEKREKLGSTGIGNGVAVPHAKLDSLDTILGAFGRSAEGLDFNAVDGEPVHLVFLVVSPFDKADAHIQALQKIFQAVKRVNFCKFLRQAKGVKDILELFHEVDEELAPGKA
jgi:mannitol/fructose-specific phosphotransferase system IIA component (Ntr-type)